MIEIADKTKVKAKIYGQEFTLTKPTVAQVEDLQSNVQKISGPEQIRAMRKWAAGLGLPEDFSADMEVEHFVQVVEGLSGIKKK